MARILFLIPLLLLTVSGASAQQSNGCSRDASRFCRAVLGQGDAVVLACLKQNRVRLSKACLKDLTDNGQ